MIITNPTHYAIAIRYRRSASPAPIVLAKGTDELAQKIKAIARHHGILMVENRPLARALYSTSKVGKAIPAELYRASRSRKPTDTVRTPAIRIAVVRHRELARRQPPTVDVGTGGVEQLLDARHARAISANARSSRGTSGPIGA